MKGTLRDHVIVIAFGFALAPTPIYAQQPKPLSPQLKNWPAPLYWAPTPAEAEQQRLEQRILQRGASPLAQPASIFTAPGPMTFIAMTPCRVMDTRSDQGFTGAFGPPSLGAFGTARQVPMPTSTTCNIPSNAGAYSLNITAVSPGVLSFLSVWPAGAAYPNVSTLNDSSPTGGAVANAAIVPAGTGGAIQMVAGNITDVIIDINGYYAAPSDLSGNTAVGTGALSGNPGGEGNTAIGAYAMQDNTTGSGNTANGDGALNLNTIGDGNTASGQAALFKNTAGNFNTATGGYALENNTTGSQSTASGYYALENNTTGSNNTASGYYALYWNTIGDGNTASGEGALQSNTTGSNNTANGAGALYSNTTGFANTASGVDVLLSNTTGSFNIAIGNSAANNVSGGNSNNIHIGSAGVAGDGAGYNSGVIRIGTPGIQTSFFVAGVSGVATGLGSPIPVVIDANGQLGTMSSSERFKEDIKDMGDASSGLLRLRPVTFRYKQPYQDGSKPIDYGLIAEEVAQVYPDLAVKGADGQVQTVQYQKLTPMLLNEVQKQAEQIRSLEDRLAALEALLP